MGRSAACRLTTPLVWLIDWLNDRVGACSVVRRSLGSDRTGLIMRRTIAKFESVPFLPRVHMIMSWFGAVTIPWIVFLVLRSYEALAVAIIMSTCLSLVGYCGWLGAILLKERLAR